jgi:hypothetical protein
MFCGGEPLSSFCTNKRYADRDLSCGCPGLHSAVGWIMALVRSSISCEARAGSLSEGQHLTSTDN